MCEAATASTSVASFVTLLSASQPAAAWLAGWSPEGRFKGISGAGTDLLILWFPACRYAEGERINGRWAMAAVAGILAQDLLGKGNWFEAGSQVLRRQQRPACTRCLR